jgi:signal transduction histidine kinase
MNKMETKEPIALLGAVTDRRLAALRLILAAAGLLIIYVIPYEPDRYLTPVYYTLGAYIAYSAIVYATSRRRINFPGSVLQRLVWADLAWYTILISMTDGVNSLFFFFYFFAIIVASSRVGYQFGLMVTAVSAALCLAMIMVAPPEVAWDMPRFVMRPLTIVGLGYILSYWGGAEIALRRKMALLNELSLVANPRFGVDWTIEVLLRRLLGFWNASYSLILLVHEKDLALYLVSNDDPQRCQRVPVKNQAEVPFIDMADPSALVYNDKAGRWTARKSYRSYDPRTRIVSPRPLPPGEALAEFLSARSFVSVPLHYRERFRGRIVVSSSQPQAFEVGDAAFLQQVASQALPLIENISLVDRLASDASEEERNRIARSVHDRVIQPYYGLQIGLKALHSVLNNGHENGRAENGAPGEETRKPAALLAELMAMTADGIDELRQYVSGLKQSRSGDTRLADSIRRFASKFEHATGIHVKVTDNTEGFVGNDRLTSEIFQMAAEALSNVHRHTQARSARVALNLDGNVIQLQVENDSAVGQDRVPFTPGSISDRANALGGRTQVVLEDDRTVLRVEVPL